MNSLEKTCDGCYWENNCPGESRCDDYTPLEHYSIDEYKSILAENLEEYSVIVKEFEDGRSEQ